MGRGWQRLHHFTSAPSTSTKWLPWWPAMAASTVFCKREHTTNRQRSEQTSGGGDNGGCGGGSSGGGGGGGGSAAGSTAFPHLLLLAHGPRKAHMPQCVCQKLAVALLGRLCSIEKLWRRYVRTRRTSTPASLPGRRCGGKRHLGRQMLEGSKGAGVELGFRWLPCPLPTRPLLLLVLLPPTALRSGQCPLPLIFLFVALVFAHSLRNHRWWLIPLRW